MSDITADRSGDKSIDNALRSLETETLLQSLFDAIENEWSNNAVEVIIKELVKKGYDRRNLIQLIELRFGKMAALNLVKTIARQ